MARGLDALFGQSPVDVEVRADVQEAVDDLEGVGRRSDDHRPAFRVFDRQVGFFARQQFATAGFTGGVPWPAVTAETLERRAQNRGGAAHPLWDTETLRSSLVEVGPLSIQEIRPLRYVRGSLVGYSGFVADPEGPRPVFPEPMPRFLERAYLGTLSDYLEGTGVFAGFRA